MVRYKGQVRPKTTERDFPNMVRFLVPEGGSYRQILVTAEPVRRRRLWADGQPVWQ